MSIEGRETSAIPIPRYEIAEFCRQHGIRELSLFGSVLRDDFGPNSDIDVLVEFRPGSGVSLFGHVRLQEELGRILARKLDLVTKNSLRGVIRNRIMALRRVEYVAER